VNNRSALWARTFASTAPARSKFQASVCCQLSINKSVALCYPAKKVSEKDFYSCGTALGVTVGDFFQADAFFDELFIAVYLVVLSLPSIYTLLSPSSPTFSGVRQQN